MASTKRENIIAADFSSVINACEIDLHCPFKDFAQTDDMLTFKYNGLDGEKYFSFCVSDDYPDNTVLSHSFTSNGPYHSEVFSGRIPIRFMALSKELYQEINIPLLSQIDEGSKEMDVSQPDSSDGEKQERITTIDSYESDDSSDFDYDDDTVYYNEDNCEDEDQLEVHPLLAQEMENLWATYGDNSLDYRIFGSIDDIDVELLISMQFLDPWVAKAWRVIREEPLVVRLHLSVSHYLDSVEPKVEVFQQSQKEKFGVGIQLSKIIQNFVATHWKTLCNEDVMATLKTRTVMAGHRKLSQHKRRLHSQSSNGAPECSQQVPTLTEQSVNPQHVTNLMDMGFSASMARNALVISRGDVEESLNLLLSNPIKCSNFVTGKASEPLPPPLPPRPVRKLSQSKRRPRLPPKQTSHSSSLSDARSLLDDLNLLPSSTQTGRNAKQIPSLDYGFLVQVMQYARQRLPTLNEFCVVCDEPHVFQNGAVLKPSVCARELCVFAFQTLGVMTDAADDIATGAEVVDLLMAMAKAACRSHRRDVIFDPYPTVVDPDNSKELSFNPKNKNYKACEQAMEAFMTIKEMTQLVGPELKKVMDKKNRLAYPLLQWIISSNRSHIVKLPSEKQLTFMHTPHQFLLISSPPAKEAIFREAKQKFGSTFAFHGSHIENWHSIMRMSLINASGTKHQMHGAAYGKGIYLSPHASVSSGYSGMGYGTPRPTRGPPPPPTGRGKNIQKPVNNHRGYTAGDRFMKSKNLTCIALCEVVTSRDLKKTNSIWVMPNPDYVCTRFFFVYEDGQVGDSNIDTQAGRYRKEIMEAVAYQAK